MGFHGRKGEDGKETTLLGSSIKTTSSFSHIPYVVYKEFVDPNKESLVYGVCIDGGKKSL